MRRLGHPLSQDSFYPLVGHNTLWQPREAMPDFSWDIVKKYDWPVEMRKRIPVYLSESKKALGKLECKRMGLPDDAWFVCLHVRESGWHKDTMVERNANVMNYTGAIREVTDRGGWVIRLGDPTMKKLPPLDKVIDYPFTASKSYAMDLYLLSECRAYIGMQSGIFSIALLFQRPMIITNMASWLYPYPQNPGDIGVLKHVYCKSKKRFLSAREWMAEPLHATSFRELSDDYVLFENEPEELEAAVREFFDCNGDGNPTSLQREFNDLRILRGHEILSNPMRPQDGIRDQRQRYRLASMLESAVGRISNEYLQKN
jgi:putative glycosyltransferase (TIGR04372 family)